MADLQQFDPVNLEGEVSSRVLTNEQYNLLAYLHNMSNNIANSDPCDRKADYEQGQYDFCNLIIRKLERGDFSDGSD